MARRKTPQQRQALQLLYEARELVGGQPRSAIQTAIELIEDRGDMALTVLHYEQLQPGKSIVDPKYTGLVMRHGKQAGKQWFFRTTDPKTLRQVNVPIGSWPEVSISEARGIRAELIAQRKAGETPVARGLGTAAVKTVADLADWYLEEYCKTKRESSTRGDTNVINRHLLPKYGLLLLEEWTAPVISAHVQELFNATEKGREAEKLRTIISAMNNASRGKSKLWAGKVDWMDGIGRSPGGCNPCGGGQHLKPTGTPKICPRNILWHIPGREWLPTAPLPKSGLITAASEFPQIAPGDIPLEPA